jgi:hypothetical protein
MTANVEHSEHQMWMIRTAENILSGPFSKQQIVQLIEEGKLDITDEVCSSSGYWIFLHEQIEVRRHLGFDLPKAFFDTEESTQTESDKTPAAHLVRSIQNTNTSAGSIAAPIAAMGTRGAARSTTLSPNTRAPGAPSNAGHTGHAGHTGREDDDQVPELSVPADSIEEQASVLSNRALREFRPRENSGGSETRVFNIETANQPEPQFSGTQAANSESHAFHDPEGTPPPIEMPETVPAPATPSQILHHNTSLSLDPEASDWTARFWGIIAFVLIAAAAVVWFFAFRKPS